MILGAYFVYMFIRKFILADVEAVAFENAVKVVSFELAGGFLWELLWQDWAIGSAKGLVIFLNWSYIITFAPIMVFVGVILYIKDRARYYYYRNVVLISFIFALIAFVVFPLAPPRFLPEYGFVDTIQTLGPSWWIGHAWYGSRDTAVFYNVFAAMPSLHFGWTILFGILFFRTKYIWVKVLGVLYPTLTFFAITLTGNHYISDAVGGVGVALVSLVCYECLLRLKASAPMYIATAKSHLSRIVVHLMGPLIRWKANGASDIKAIASHSRAQRFSGIKRKLGLLGPLPMSKAKRT